MEITGEIKMKVFAQYIGQMVRINAGKDRKLIAVGGVDDEPYITMRLGDAKKCFIHTDLLKNFHGKLILKPLSAITDEDAMAICEMDYRLGIDLLKMSQGERVKYGLNNKNFIIQQTVPYQYLQSRGYDLPKWLLGGKTLFESGLAVYE